MEEILEVPALQVVTALKTVKLPQPNTLVPSRKLELVIARNNEC